MGLSQFREIIVISFFIDIYFTWLPLIFNDDYQTEHLSRKSCSWSNLEEFRGREESLERGRITPENAAALTIAGLPYFIRRGSSINTLSKWVYKRKEKKPIIRAFPQYLEK